MKLLLDRYSIIVPKNTAIIWVQKITWERKNFQQTDRIILWKIKTNSHTESKTNYEHMLSNKISITFGIYQTGMKIYQSFGLYVVNTVHIL